MAILAATTTKMMIPIDFNSDLLSSITTTTMVTTVLTLPAGRVSSISFRRRHQHPRATTAAAAHVSLKASSSRCSPNWVTKSGSCDVDHPMWSLSDPAPDESKIRIHLERCESMEKKMYQHILEEEKLYQNLFESAHLWERSKTMKKIYHYYKKAVYESGHPNKRSIVISNSALANAIVSMLHKCPFEFPMHHQAIRAPFDYYEFGLKYFRPLIDFENSYLGNISVFQEIEEKIQKGENVILMSNIQGKADHVFVSLLLESTRPFISENMTYVMKPRYGPDVSYNPFYKIFIMGRNFIDYQEPKALRGYFERTSYHCLVWDEIVSTLRSGSQLIWYSLGIPYRSKSSKPDDQSWKKFREEDPRIRRASNHNARALWMMNDLAYESDVPFHVYPVALLCTDTMPHQKQLPVERLVSFHGAGLSVGRRIDFDSKKHARRDKLYELPEKAYGDLVNELICQQEMVLKSAIIEKQGLAASNDMVSLSQPFSSWPFDN